MPKIRRLRHVETGEIFAWDHVLAGNPLMRETFEDAPEDPPPEISTTGVQTEGQKAIADMDKTELLALAESLGLKIDGRLTEQSIRQKIEESLSSSSRGEQ